MKIQVFINEGDLREAIFDANVGLKKKDRLTATQVKAKMKAPGFLEALGGALISSVVETLSEEKTDG